MKLNLLKVLSVLWIAVAKPDYGLADESGLSQFWAENFNDQRQKSFHQIYGKTSDRDLYGESLPLSTSHGINAKKFKKSDALNIQSFGSASDSSAAGTLAESYELSDGYAQLLANRKRSKNTPKTRKAVQYGPAFTADESVMHFKPASEATDQTAIHYMKQFEQLGTQQEIDFPQEGLSGFKPYAGLTFSNGNSQPLILDSYKSIQDIIDANDNYEDEVFERQKANHELAHKVYGNKPKINFENVKKIPSGVQLKSNKPGVRFVQGNSIGKKPIRGNCSSGRCRKPPTQLRLRKVKPRVRKITHRIVTL